MFLKEYYSAIKRYEYCGESNMKTETVFTLNQYSASHHQPNRANQNKSTDGGASGKL